MTPNNSAESSPLTPASTSGSIRWKITLALLSFTLMASVTTWPFSLLILCTIAFHEQGHVWAMRRCGVPTKGFYLLPFVGGAAVALKEAKQQRQQVIIVLMGPAWGFALALAVFALYSLTGVPFFAASAWFMAMVNLFNLLPVNPLDGGRLLVAVAGSIGPHAGLGFMVVSTAACLGGTIFGAFPPLLGGLITWVSFNETLAFRGKAQPEGMSCRGAIRAILAYLVLAFMLAGLLVLANQAPGSGEAFKALLGRPR